MSLSITGFRLSSKRVWISRLVSITAAVGPFAGFKLWMEDEEVDDEDVEDDCDPAVDQFND